MGFFNRNELESKVYTIMIYVYDYECKSNKNQKTICLQEILPYHQNKMYLFIYNVFRIRLCADTQIPSFVQQHI